MNQLSGTVYLRILFTWNVNLNRSCAISESFMETSEIGISLKWPMMSCTRWTGMTTLLISASGIHHFASWAHRARSGPSNVHAASYKLGLNKQKFANFVGPSIGVGTHLVLSVEAWFSSLDEINFGSWRHRNRTQKAARMIGVASLTSKNPHW